MDDLHPPQSVIVTRVACDEDLAGVVRLQQENLGRNLPEAHRQFSGFLSVETPLELLERINNELGITVALSGDQLAGFLMPMSLAHAQEVPLMHPLLVRLASITVDGKPLADFRFCLLGQVCVDHRFRGQGIVEALYENLTQRYSPYFDFALGENRADNPRSLRVHLQKLGLELVDQYDADGARWCIVMLRFGKEPSA